jgi:cobalamin synthase
MTCKTLPLMFVNNQIGYFRFARLSLYLLFNTISFMTILQKLFKVVMMCLLAAGLLSMPTACKKYKNNTDKRIQKQKQRQKKNPGDCPRIDC